MQQKQQRSTSIQWCIGNTGGKYLYLCLIRRDYEQSRVFVALAQLSIKYDRDEVLIWHNHILQIYYMVEHQYNPIYNPFV